MQDLINKIHNADCLEFMKQLPDNSIDLVLTSPPYDNLRTYNDTLVWNENIWKNIIKQLFRIIKVGGVCVWIVGDATINGSETGTSFKQALFFKEIGFNLHDTMIYSKTNPIPLTHNRYEQAFEYMFVFSKGRPKTFNPLLEQCKTFGNYTHRRNTGRVKESATRNRDEITKVKDTKYKCNIFSYKVGNEKGETGTHPAPFPKELAIDNIVSWSNENDLILDCFSGSGTTAIACSELKRNFICIEKDKQYYEASCQRLENYNKQLKLF